VHETEQQEQDLQQGRKRWLAYFLSQEAMRKIRVALMSAPNAAQQLQQAGKSLAQKGVQLDVKPIDNRDIGQLSATTHAQKQGQDTGKVR